MPDLAQVKGKITMDFKKEEGQALRSNFSRGNATGTQGGAAFQEGIILFLTVGSQKEIVHFIEQVEEKIPSVQGQS